MKEMESLIQALTLQTQGMERMVSTMQELIQTFDRMTDAMLADGSDGSDGDEPAVTYMDGTPVG